MLLGAVSEAFMNATLFAVTLGAGHLVARTRGLDRQAGACLPVWMLQ
jgi:hypothetical protein